jgi:hypothetical protein
MNDTINSMNKIVNSVHFQGFLDKALENVRGFVMQDHPCPWEKARAVEFLRALSRAQEIANNDDWDQPDGD